MPVMNNQRSFDFSFRSRDVERVMRCLSAHRSCALIGVDGIGKTSLLRYLVAEPVRERYLGGQHEHFIFLLIDAHELAVPSTLAYCRMLAFLLEPELKRRGISFSDEQVLTLSNETVVQQTLFERVAALLAQDEQLSLALFFDTFDIALVEGEPHLLRMLQALRERSDGRVNYVIGSKNEPLLLGQQRGQTVVCLAFEEIFNGNVWPVLPFTERDARETVERWVGVDGLVRMGEGVYSLLQVLTGAHPGLLKAAVGAVAEQRVTLAEHDKVPLAARKLLSDATVSSKCEQLWRSFSEIEQACLKRMQNGIAVRRVLVSCGTPQEVNQAIHALIFKGIWIEVGKEVYHCFSAILSAYIAQCFAQSNHGLQLDAPHRQVWIDGVLCPRRLPLKEFKLLVFLAARAGEICSREEINQEIYGEAYSPERDDGRLDALVARTREHIGDSSRSPRFLETIRGVGHCLHEYIGSYT